MKIVKKVRATLVLCSVLLSTVVTPVVAKSPNKDVDRKCSQSQSSCHRKKKCDAPAFTKRGLDIYKEFVAREIIVSPGFEVPGQVAPGWGTVAIDGCKKTFENYQGYRDIDFYGGGANPKPMAADTIVRIASESKFITAVAFLTLADKGYAAQMDNVSDYIPEFADTVVIEPCSPYTFKKLGNDPYATVNGSPVVTVTHENHGMVTGDFVILTESPNPFSNGIIEAFLISTFQVNVLDPDHYQIVALFGTPASATGDAGGYNINAAPVAVSGSFALPNSLSTTNLSNVVTVVDAAHNFNVGDVIGIQLLQIPAAFPGGVSGIPYNEIVNVHTITASVPGVSYSFQVTTPANATLAGQGGAFLRVFPLCFGAQQEVWPLPLSSASAPFQIPTVYYWKPQQLVSPLKVHHLLTHTSGHMYGVNGLPVAGNLGFDPNVVGVYAGVANRVGPATIAFPNGSPLPEAVPNPALPLSQNPSATALQTWAATYASVPLLYQPGSQWSYGPQLGIVGAVIEQADPLGRGLEQFMKEELFDPIGMPDTGFFVQGGPGNPQWDNKVNRFMVLYDNSFAAFGVPFIPVDAVFPPLNPLEPHNALAALAGFLQDYNYAGPRALPLGDGGMFSTLRDYAKFLEVIINNGKTEKGKVILSPAMIATLSRNQINDLDVTADNRVFLNKAGQEIKYSKWGLGVGLQQGINIETLGVSRKQLTWGGVFVDEYSADLSNQVVMHLGTNILTLQATELPWRAAFLGESLLYNALNKVNTFDEELYTPGTASPSNYNLYHPTAQS